MKSRNGDGPSLTTETHMEGAMQPLFALPGGSEVEPKSTDATYSCRLLRGFDQAEFHPIPPVYWTSTVTLEI